MESQNPDDQKNSLESIVRTCLDSPGYVIFVATINPLTKEQVIINNNYRRYHFSIEDSQRAVEAFQEAVVSDLKNKS